MLGDWLEMPKYGADGAVIDIGLTIKVRNWDNTITTIHTGLWFLAPLKTGSGMSASGGHGHVAQYRDDVTSIRFLDEDEMQRLDKARPIVQKPYLTQPPSEINEWNHGKVLRSRY